MRYRELFGASPVPGRAGTARTRILLALALALCPGVALADEVPALADQMPGRADLVFVPTECLPYWLIRTGVDSPTAWNQVLSFAGCVQDASIGAVTEPDQVADLVARLETGLAPSLQFYVAALQYGPASVQLRAAFQIGMTQVALITRARASLVAPDDRATNAAAAARYRKLQARLEPLLEEPAKLAWMLFALIERVGMEDPTIVLDDVTRRMVHASAALERSLRWSVSIPLDEPPTQPMLATPVLTSEPRRIPWPTITSSNRTSRSQAPG